MQLCQLGQHVVPVESILSIDLNYPREQGGSNVRVWLRSQGSNLYPAMPPNNQAPHFIDFLGNQAQSIRRWATNVSKQGGLTVILGEAETSTTASVTPPGSAHTPAAKIRYARRKTGIKASGATTAAA